MTDTAVVDPATRPIATKSDVSTTAQFGSANLAPEKERADPAVVQALSDKWTPPLADSVVDDDRDSIVGRPDHVVTGQDDLEPAPPVPTIGRIVGYRLSGDDATAINRRRVYSPAPDAGGVRHVGNTATAGEVYPMMITAITNKGVNGQVFTDGNDVLWVKGVARGGREGEFDWPRRP